VKKPAKRTVLVLLLLPGLWVAAALIFPQWFLTVDSGPVTAEAIVLLGGGSHDRYERVVKLFQDRAAPRIIISGYGDCEINRYLLIKAGVPANVILLEKQSRTTQENAQFTVKLLREQKFKRVIVVTSWYHSRRALACFWHYAPDIRFYSRPSLSPATRAAEWRSRSGSRARLEYLKLAGYWVRYGICPF
jgi:uncharacterized SAM-binding protein YcdF (DUF218 family)